MAAPRAKILCVNSSGVDALEEHEAEHFFHARLLLRRITVNTSRNISVVNIRKRVRMMSVSGVPFVDVEIPTSQQKIDSFYVTETRKIRTSTHPHHQHSPRPPRWLRSPLRRGKNLWLAKQRSERAIKQRRCLIFNASLGIGNFMRFFQPQRKKLSKLPEMAETNCNVTLFGARSEMSRNPDLNLPRNNSRLLWSFHLEFQKIFSDRKVTKLLTSIITSYKYYFCTN